MSNPPSLSELAAEIEPHFVRLTRRHSHSATELTDYALLKLWKAQTSGRSIEKPLGYLYLVGLNHHKKILGRVRQHQSTEINDARADTRPSPEDEVEHAELEGLIRDYLAREFPEEQMKALERHIFESAKPAAIAAEMNRNRSTIGRWFERGLPRLQRFLRETMGIDLPPARVA